MNDLDLPLRGPALYNPHLLSKAEVIGLFSAREALLEELLEDLRSVPPGQPAQHHLIVGQRGMGKTMLLRRIQFAVEDDPELQETWLALSFPEEQYNVAALSDFWLNCIDALSDTLERLGSSPSLGESAEVIAELDEEVDALRRLPEEERVRRAFQVLEGAAGSLGRRFLLLLDNADLVLDRIDDQEWSLREVLSSKPTVTFLGASAAAIESTYEYDKAFYDFFRIHDLAGLTVEETQTLLLRYAAAQENDDVRRIALEETGRLRALHTLTGGNPRTLVLLFNIFAQGPEGDVRSDLEQLLDHCTPLYKARFEALPPQAQQVVDALALHWDPTSAGELAEELRLPVNNVSAQLNRLVNQGIVEKVPYDPESKIGFQVAERFFNIWYLMRASRRVRRRLVWLVEFLRIFYGQEELRHRAQNHLRRLRDLASYDRLRHAEYSFALASAVEEHPMRGVLERSALHILAGHEDLRGMLRELVDLEGSDASLAPRAEYLERYEALRKQIAGTVAEAGTPSEEPFWRALLRAPLLIEDKEWFADRGLLLAEDKAAKRFIEALLNVEARTIALGAADSGVENVLRAVETGVMTSVDDLEGAELAEATLEVTGLMAVAAAMRCARTRAERDLDVLEACLEGAGSFFPWFVWLKQRGPKAVPEKVEHAIRRGLSLAAGTADSLSDLGFLLAQLQRPREAAEAFRRAIALEPGVAASWSGLAASLRAQGQLQEAEAAVRKALEIEPKDPMYWWGLAILLRDQDRTSEAEVAYRRATVLGPEDARTWTHLAGFLGEQGQVKEAEEAYREAVRLNPRMSDTWCQLGLLLEEQARVTEAEEMYRRGAEANPMNSPAWHLRVLLLKEQGRWSEAEEICRAAIGGGLEDPGLKNALAWLLFERRGNMVEAEEVARAVVSAQAAEPDGNHTLACILVRNGKWSEAVEPARRFLGVWASDLPEGRWRHVLTFFREAVAAGKAWEAAVLLDELELGERWRPLREALEALARENPKYLRRIAPEVRKPAEAILQELTAAPDAGG